MILAALLVAVAPLLAAPAPPAESTTPSGPTVPVPTATDALDVRAVLTGGDCRDARPLLVVSVANSTATAATDIDLELLSGCWASA